MQLTFFLDIEEAQFLRRLLPPASSASKAVDSAITTHQYWGSIGRDVYVECDDRQADELLGYAYPVCPKVADKIREAFQLARLRVGARRDSLRHA
jgi:hypothetical protein